MRSLKTIIDRARKMKRISEYGLVICDNCNNPADKYFSQALSWTVCGPCVTGESGSLDEGGFITDTPSAKEPQ